MKQTRKQLAAALAACTMALGTPALAQVAHDGVDRHHGDRQYAIEVLSGRPDAITGGDALVRVTVGKKVPASGMRIKLNGADISSSFVAGPGMLTGLVSGMRMGENLLEVTVEFHETEPLHLWYWPLYLTEDFDPSGDPLITNNP